MIRNFLKIALLLVFVSACTSSNKKGEGADGAMSESAVSSKAMNFDPMGSDSGKIEGLQSVNFEYDRAGLTADAKAVLKKNADWMKTQKDLTIQIEGHCDSRGSIEYNLSLGERRARTVKKYLESLGVDGKKMNIISYGKEKLIDSGDGNDAHAKNRRANFVPLAN